MNKSSFVVFINSVPTFITDAFIFENASMLVDMLIAHVLIDGLYCRRTKTPDGLKITILCIQS